MMKTNCPHCQQRVEYGADWAGEEVDCPGCSARFQLPDRPTPECPPPLPGPADRIAIPQTGAARVSPVRRVIFALVAGILVYAVASAIQYRNKYGLFHHKTGAHASIDRLWLPEAATEVTLDIDGRGYSGSFMLTHEALKLWLDEIGKYFDLSNRSQYLTPQALSGADKQYYTFLGRNDTRGIYSWSGAIPNDLKRYRIEIVRDRWVIMGGTSHMTVLYSRSTQRVIVEFNYGDCFIIGPGNFDPQAIKNGHGLLWRLGLVKKNCWCHKKRS